MHFQIRMYSKSFTEAIRYPSVLGSFHTYVLVHVPTVTDWVRALGSMFLSLSGLISLSPSHIQNSLSSCLHSIPCWGQCSFLWKLSPRSIVTCQDAFQQTPVRLCHVCLSKMGSSRVQFLHSAQFCSESKNPTMIHCYSSIFCHFGSVSGFCPYTEMLGRVPWSLQNWQ